MTNKKSMESSNNQSGKKNRVRKSGPKTKKTRKAQTNRRGLMSIFFSKPKKTKKRTEGSIKDSYQSIFGFWLTRIIDWYSLLLVFLIPIYFLPVSVSPLYFQKNLFFEISVGILSFLLLVHFMTNGQVAYPKSKIRVALVVLSGTYITSFIMTQNKVDGLKSYFTPSNLITILSLTLFFLILTTRFNDFKKLYKVINVLLASGLVLTIYALMQFAQLFILPWEFTKEVSFNPVGSVNALAFASASFLIVSTAVFLFTKKIWMRVFYMSLMVLSLLTMIIVANKEAWILVFISALLLLIGYYYRSTKHMGKKKEKPFLKLSITPSVIVVLLLVLISGYSLLRNSSNALTSDSESGTFFDPDFTVEVAPSLSKTTDITKELFNEPFRTIMLGTGPGTFVNNYNSYQGTSLNETAFWNIDFAQGANFIYTCIIETGVFGFISYLLLTLAVAYSLIKGALVIKRSNGLTAEEFGLYITSLVFVLLTFVSLFLYQGNLVLLFLFFVALVLNVATHSLVTGEERLDNYRYILLSGDNQWSTFASLAILLAIIVNVVFLWTDTKRVIAFGYYSQGIDHYNKNNINESIHMLQRSIEINGNDPLALQQASKVSLSKVQELELANNPDKQAEAEIYYNEAIQYAKTATEVCPGDAESWRFLGNIYESSIYILDDDSRDIAFQYAYNNYQVAIDLEPNNPARRITMVRLAILYSDLLEARINEEKKNEEVLDSESDSYKNIVSWHTSRQNVLLMGYKSAQRAVELKTNYVVGYYAQAQIYERMAKYEEALIALDNGLELEGDNVDLMLLKGFVFYKKKDYSKAETILLRVTEMRADYVDARYFLGLTYQELGDLTKAQTNFDIYKQENPEASVPTDEGISRTNN